MTRSFGVIWKGTMDFTRNVPLMSSQCSSFVYT
uniref:Uncharacterized protein n=1 Tax=Arundo donax TaxID=35708 RepID=A0A0A9CQN2_ARUDO